MTLGVSLYSRSTLKKVNIHNDKILGRWCSLSAAADYPNLTFGRDGCAIFDCKIDTIFGLKYTLNKKQLILMPTSKTGYKIKILKLTQDSLVLGTLLEHKTAQVYYRCKK